LTKTEDDDDGAKKDVVSLHGFAGVRPSVIPELIHQLQVQKLGAHLGRDLDRTIYKLIKENDWFDGSISNKKKALSPEDQIRLQFQALDYAATGDTQSLRRMSLDGQQCRSIVTARDEMGRTCLHLAVLNSHWPTSYWLLVEAQCCKDEKDCHGKTAYEYAMESPTMNSKLIHVFEVLTKEEKATTNCG
jgi:hypothetical protein